MSKQYPGGFITKTPVVPAGPYQCGAASGIWTLDQAMNYQKQGIWPIAGNARPGQQAYTTSGTYSWVAPAGVTSVSVVAVGAGGGSIANAYGGSGGALAYTNNITVVPGNSYSVVVGAGGNTSGSAGGLSSFNCSSVKAGGGTSGGSGFGGTVINGTGGSGGNNNSNLGAWTGGGGAGGYSGSGGGAGYGYSTQPTSGSGGGGAGGGSQFLNNSSGGGGGGVGLLGQGTSGVPLNDGPYGTSYGAAGSRGGGGSGGANGGLGGGCLPGGNGGSYGGGGGGPRFTQPSCVIYPGGSGGGGAVRIIWPGTTRSFPSTCTGNL